MYHKKVVVKIKTNVFCLRFFFFFFLNLAVYEICGKCRRAGQATITMWRMRIACWINKATDIHSEFVVLFVFALLQWLQASASMLRYTCIAFLVSTASTSTLDPFLAHFLT